MQKDHDLHLVCELHKKALSEICKLEKSFNRMGCYIIFYYLLALAGGLELDHYLNF